MIRNFVVWGITRTIEAIGLWRQVLGPRVCPQSGWGHLRFRCRPQVCGAAGSEASEEEELRSRLVEEFSRLRREDEARTAATVGSLASLVSRPATKKPRRGECGPRVIKVNLE